MALTVYVTKEENNTINQSKANVMKMEPSHAQASFPL